MRFGFMIDGPEYRPKYLEADSIGAALNILEKTLPERMRQIPSQSASERYIELWQDKGVERKNMSFQDLADVYKLYPSRSGNLICNELMESLWEELQNSDLTIKLSGEERLKKEWNGFYAAWPKTAVEGWIGRHHSRGLDYLRYGELGISLGPDRLAQLGRQLLEKEHILTGQYDISASMLYNLLGLSREDCLQANLVLSSAPYFTVYASEKPLNGKSFTDTTAKHTSQWYQYLDEGLSGMAELAKEGYQNLSIYFNDQIPIGHMVNGVYESPADLTPNELAQTQDVQAGFQAFKAGFHPECIDRLFFYVGDSSFTPSHYLSEIKDSCLDSGVYDLNSALKKLEGGNDKTLFVCVGRDLVGYCDLQPIPLITKGRNGQYQVHSSPLTNSFSNMFHREGIESMADVQRGVNTSGGQQINKHEMNHVHSLDRMLFQHRNGSTIGRDLVLWLNQNSSCKPSLEFQMMDAKGRQNVSCGVQSALRKGKVSGYDRT